MNSLTSRCGAALLIASALAACGGSGGGSLPVSGTINGMNGTRTALVLTNGGKRLELTTPVSSFSFPDLLAPDTEFEVKVEKSPNGQQCTASNNKNKINYYTYSTTVINCITDPYPLGGTITGLTSNGLVLANGSNTAAPLAGATKFTFVSQVPNGALFGVTVLSQPAGQTCILTANASGIMPVGAKEDIAVSCK
ncbi:hypothetical protein LJR289_004412 [Pseudoduganella sp. LjRoot289]|uniref:hypothetical protein n=1 Tax=Pseudoduganella sp. LjRoot289 TaxID=3342314 RepID=UPI003ECD09C2